MHRNDRGVYRMVPVMIAGALISPVEPSLIHGRMEELIKWYSQDNKDDFLTKLALLHIRFESIHPFIDGNGSTGRLIVNLEVMKAGFPPIDIKVTDRKACYDAFDSYARTNSPKAMAKLFAKHLTQRLGRYISILKPTSK